MTDFEMHRGDDKRYELVVTNKQTGAVVDITGCTIKMTWKQSLEDTSNFLQKTFSLTDPSNGVAEVYIPSADTVDLYEETEFYYDVEVIKPSTEKETLCSGKFTVKLDVTT